MTTIIAMLIYAGAYGSAGVITGFDSLQSCQANIPAVKEFYTRGILSKNDVKCIVLTK